MTLQILIFRHPIEQNVKEMISGVFLPLPVLLLVFYSLAYHMLYCLETGFSLLLFDVSLFY